MIIITYKCDCCGDRLPESTELGETLDGMTWWLNFRQWLTIGKKHFCPRCKSKAKYAEKRERSEK